MENMKAVKDGGFFPQIVPAPGKKLLGALRLNLVKWVVIIRKEFSSKRRGDILTN